MKKALIAFGSRTGNTAEIAQWIAGRLEHKGFDAVPEDCADLLAEGLCVPFDLIVLGTPSYDDEPDDVQRGFRYLLDNLEHTGIAGKQVAVFGTGSSQYPRFCGAVDIAEERVRACGGTLILPSLKIDSPYLAYRLDIEAWADRVAEAA